jgi:hypothetical protein
MTELKCTAVTHAHIRRILHPRYALAIERGLFTPPDPEWWPEEEG